VRCVARMAGVGQREPQVFCVFKQWKVSGKAVPICNTNLPLALLSCAIVQVISPAVRTVTVPLA
jgi:hypothetical protein